MLFLLIFFLVTNSQSHATTDHEFICKGFNNTDLSLFGASVVVPNRALMLTSSANHIIGRAFYPHPMHMFFQDNNNVSKPFSFSTYFVFSIVPPPNARGGYGIAFVISPSTDFPGAQGEHNLGIFNSSTSSTSPNNSILAVEFDTVNGHNENYDTAGNHVGINLNNITSLATRELQLTLLMRLEMKIFKWRKSQRCKHGLNMME